MEDISRESIRTFASKSISWIRILQWERRREGLSYGGEDTDKNNTKKLKKE